MSPQKHNKFTKKISTLPLLLVFDVVIEEEFAEQYSKNAEICDLAEEEDASVTAWPDSDDAVTHNQDELH
jgi:hypothetical protein